MRCKRAPHLWVLRNVVLLICLRAGQGSFVTQLHLRMITPSTYIVTKSRNAENVLELQSLSQILQVHLENSCTGIPVLSTRIPVLLAARVSWKKSESIHTNVNNCLYRNLRIIFLPKKMKILFQSICTLTLMYTCGSIKGGPIGPIGQLRRQRKLTKVTTSKVSILRKLRLSRK